MDLEFFNGLWADRYLIAGLLAAGLSAFAYVPYIMRILAGHVKPDRTCWLIWAVLATLSGGSNLIEGAGTSLMFIASQVFGTVLICGLSIRFGSGDILNKFNLILLSVAAFGIGTWLVTDEAVFALAMSIGVSMLAVTRTVWKAYVAPASEKGRAWPVLLVSSILGVYSVGGLDPVLLAYPLYLFTLYACVMVARGLGQRAVIQLDNEAARIARRRRVPPITSTPRPVIRVVHASLENGLA